MCAVAYYLAVDDVDRRAEAATANGARLVVAPFDAGDQGRTATLIDPVGAPFSLWQPHGSTGWKFPPRLAGAPHHMVLASGQPDRARDFYHQLTGTPLPAAAFIAAREPITTPHGNSASGSMTWRASSPACRSVAVARASLTESERPTSPI
nr:hypothetical protein [Streptomyces sp. A1499]